MSRTAQDMFHRRMHKCFDCATLVDINHMYCQRCAKLVTPTTPHNEPSTTERAGQ